MTKIIGIVVLYYPEKDVVNNIFSYLPFLDSLILWYNSPIEEIKESLITNLPPESKLIHMGTGTNAGMGKALNAAVQYAQENDFTHILTMDQDSRFEEGAFSNYIQQVASVQDDAVMAFSPNTFQMETPDWFITSGTIHPLSVFDKIGLFREDFFIDAIDTEYSFRIKKYNYKTLHFLNIHMDHRMGNVIVTPFLWGKLTTPNYSAVRTYYIVRNYIVLRRLYDNRFQFFPKCLTSYFLWRPINILLVEKDKWNKLKKILLGILDGLRLKTGEFN
jgi:rhamnosyltransferase